MLIGRERERAAIDRALQQAREGETAALVLVGEPGAGKTALLRHALDASEGMVVVRATGIESEAELEYSGLLEVCRPLLADLDALPARQAASLRVALGLESGAAPDRFEVGAATLGLLAAAAEREPVLVLADDAHWLDGVSTGALLFAARRLLADRVAFVFATRPDGLDARGLEALDVRGLDKDAAAALVAETADRTVAPGVLELLYETTGGNPLALLELPRRLSAAQLAGDEPLEGPLPVGAEIERAFASRLDELPESTRRALCVLAAAGSDDLATAFAAIGSMELAPEDLGPAEDAGLVVLEATSFRFAHPLLRPVVYHARPLSERREAHRALARAFEGTRDVERRAWHLAAAAVGPDEAAAEALAEAAVVALGRGGHAAAAKALERSARLTAALEDRLARLLEAANAAWNGGDSDRARALVDEVSTASPPEALRASVVHLAGRIEFLAGSLDCARALFLESAELAEASNPAEAARALGFVMFTCLNQGRISDAVATGRRARELAAAADDPRVVLQAEYVLARALLLAGETEEGGELLDGVVERMLEGEPDRLALARIAVALTVLGRSDGATEHVQRSIALAREEGPMVLAQGLSVQTAIAVRTGDWRTALGACGEGLDLARQLGQENAVSVFLNDLAYIQAVRGEEERCRETARLASAGFERSGADAEQERLRCTLGLLELGLDRHTEAIELLIEASENVDRMELCDRDVSPEPDLVEALVRADRADEAARHLDRWLRRGAEGTYWGPPLAERCRGLVADAGAFDAAFERALRFHEALRDPFQLARTRLAYGQRLRREGRRVDSRTQLRQALEAFESLEAEPWAERARQELRASGAKLRKRAESGEELTPQERQIALQVAEGKANKEVAAAMFLSPKTVEFHLSRIYRKLGLSSRAELVRRFAAELSVAAG